ncbi:MAG TPA: xanthine dehydrogenase family protein subunit M [Solirubrobacteraceae bacterium]|jgi:xanthine dehydrogenase YagS FAD-binding subunit|nr:xanthine dehydrogenase family protein subunit M [Solirubrobacteraceae bacterium]
MKPFAYERPVTAADAVAALAAGGSTARYLGGGTNLVDLMKLGVDQPDHLVDVSRLSRATIDETHDGGLLIGGGVLNSQLAADPIVRARYPVLARALLSGASGQLRNQATVAGNLLQRTRCSYFQDISKPCNKRRPGSGCPARDGHHRELAILGHSASCLATHPSDMAVAMTVLDARIRLLGTDGPREIPLAELYRLPGDQPDRETQLDPGDLITAIELPPLTAAHSDYRKVRDRASFAFALVSVAALLDVADGHVRESRIAFGGIAPIPWRARRAERVLRGAPATPESFARAAAAELDLARPLPDNAFKVTLAANLLVETLVDLAQR